MRDKFNGLVIVAAVLLGTTLWTYAAGPGEPSALVPYHGYLERDGAALNTPTDLRVGLFTSAAADTSCLEAGVDGCGVWADEFVATPVAAGHFSLALGSGAALPASTFLTDQLYVGVAVGDGAGSFAALSGLQRIASVPYAVRGEEATDLNVASTLTVGGDADVGNDLTVGRDIEVIGDLGVGTATPDRALHVENGELRVRAGTNDDTPDIAQFFAQNLTQGVGIGYRSIVAIGSNASQDLMLRPKGSGIVYLDGRAQVASTLNVNGTEQVYYSDLGKYVAVAPPSDQLRTRSYVSISETTLVSYCGDEDGCRITLRMRNWNDGQGPASQRTAVSVSMHFHYGEKVNGVRHWRREVLADPAAANGNIILGVEAATDGDGAINHVVRNHDCYFTDGFYPVGNSGPSNDGDVGMGLLNYFTSYTPTCELIIED